MEEDKEIRELEESEITSTDNTGIKISNDVIASIAGIAVSEVPGVYSMAGGLAGGISEVFSGKKNLSKGISIHISLLSILLPPLLVYISLTSFC